MYTIISTVGIEEIWLQRRRTLTTAETQGRAIRAREAPPLLRLQNEPAKDDIAGMALAPDLFHRRDRWTPETVGVEGTL